MSGESTAGVLFAGPLDQVVDVLEVVIEGHTVDAAVLCDVVDGNFAERLLQEQIFERCGQRPLGNLGHRPPLPAVLRSV